MVSNQDPEGRSDLMPAGSTELAPLRIRQGRILSGRERARLGLDFVRWCAATRSGRGLKRTSLRQPRPRFLWPLLEPEPRTYLRILSRSWRIVWIASVSKSGNTWLRYLLFNSLFGVANRAGMPEETIPHWASLLDAVSRRTARATPAGNCLLLKTHTGPQPVDTGLMHFLQPLTAGAIYLYRNPVDVCLSQIRHMRLVGKYPRATDRELAFHFLESRLFPAEGHWFEHVTAWQRVTAFPVLFVRYEELKRSTAAVLRQILTFLGESVSTDRLDQAIAQSDLRTMRALEDAQGTGLGYRTARGDSTARFVNGGRSGQSVAQFGSDFVRAFDRRYGDAMVKLGYERPLTAAARLASS
ncbi:MAG TPA: sulfotransferase domain-containing protein [Vicinamibacterales bacterium]|nr:sulfotransferase domain-containing protein [Vicinamibacterales bacterium]